MSKVSVIIPAAGAGTRFGAEQNKIFEPIGNQPVFLRTLQRFASRDDVREILLVVSREDMPGVLDRFGERLSFLGVRVVQGGSSRGESVRNALAKVSDESELVCVHDAVRPCVASAWIDEVFQAATKCGAAILAYPVHGTLKKADGAARITATVSRDRLWEAQTPQVFRRELLFRAYEQQTEQGTDDAQLVESPGEPVQLVLGDPRNIKITTQADLRLAAAVIETLPESTP